MAIELATKYVPYVDELFTKESKKDLVTNQDFKFDGAHEVKIYKISSSKMNDYRRNGAEEGNWSRYGEVNDLDAATESCTMKQDRSFTFAIDSLDTDETGMALNGASALARQLREVVVPEVDAYTYTVMAEKAGTRIESADELTSDVIYDEIIKASEVLDSAMVPDEGRCLIVTPATYLLMKRCKDIVMETNIGSDMRLKGVIGNLDGAKVIKVNASCLPAGFGFMLCHKCATVAPTKLASYVTHLNPPGINGTLVEGRIVYDAFVLENKAKAIYYYQNPVTETVEE